MKKSSRKRLLQWTIALGILAAVNAPAYAMQEEIISYGGYDIFRVQYFDAADRDKLNGNEKNLWNQEGIKGLAYPYNTAMKQSIRGAFEQWAEILYRNGKTMKQPGLFLVGTSDESGNAGAGSVAMEVTPNAEPVDISNDNFLAVFQKGLECGEMDLFTDEYKGNSSVLAFGQVHIGQNIGANLENNGAYYGWIYAPLTQQNQSESAVPLQAVLYHEIAHALGIICDTENKNKTEEGNADAKYVFSDLLEGSNNFASHLIDQKGNQAAEGKEISSSDEGDVFYVENVDTAELSADSKEGRAYFVGANVSEVLRGNGEAVKKFQGAGLGEWYA